MASSAPRMQQNASASSLGLKKNATLNSHHHHHTRRTHTPPPQRLVAVEEAAADIRQQHLLAKAKRRQTQLQADIDRLPPLMPSPFFTFHIPPPSQKPTRQIRKPRHSAPAVSGGNPFLHAYHTSSASFKPFSTTFIPISKRQRQYESPLDLPSSDAIEPVNLQLQDEDVDMMDLDDDNDRYPTTECDDPFV